MASDDDGLYWLQVKVAEARRVHEDMARRRDAMRMGHFLASARNLDAQVRAAFNDLQRAKAALLDYTMRARAKKDNP